MNTKEKELIAVAVSVAAGCEPCTQYHVRAAREANASDGELKQIVEVALGVRERATQRMAAVAWEELGTKVEFPGCGSATPPTKLEALASAASALAANCGAGIAGFLASAVEAGASEREAEVALGIARQIKKVAAEKADQLSKGETAPSRPCGCASMTREAEHATCC